MRKNRLIALIGTLTMAAAGLAAVSAGVSSKKVDSVSAAGTKRIYFDYNGIGLGNNARLHYWGGSSGSAWPGTQINQSNKIAKEKIIFDNRNHESRDYYYWEIDSGHTEAILTNSNGSDVWNRWNKINISSYNLIKLTNWGVNKEDETTKSNYDEKKMYSISLEFASGTKDTEYSIPDWCTNGYSAPTNTSGYVWVYKGTTNQYTAKKLTADIELVEYMPQSTYSISFDAGDGEGTMSPVNAEADEDYTLPSSSERTIHKSKMHFDYWDDGNGNHYGDGDVIEAGTYDVGDEITLTAVYREYDIVDGYYIEFFNKEQTALDRRIKLDYNGKTGSDSQHVKTGVSLAAGDTFKIVYYEDEAIPSGRYFGTEQSNPGSQFENAPNKGQLYADSDNNFVVRVAGTYDFYFNDQYESYKVWIPANSYTVVYDNNGGSGTIGDQKAYFYDNSTDTGKGFAADVYGKSTFTAPDSTKIFDGWSTNKNATQGDLKPGDMQATADKVPNPTSGNSVTLYAIWRDKNPADGYYVKIFTDGHQANIPMELKDGSTTEYVVNVDLAKNDEFKVVYYQDEVINESTGYHGYTELKSGDGSAKDSNELTGTDNIVASKAGNYEIYYETGSVNPGIWAPNLIDVTFNANGHGTAPEGVTVRNGNAISDPGDLSEDDWTFTGWFEDQACQNEWDFTTNLAFDSNHNANYTVDSANNTCTKTLYAGWEEEITDPTVTVEVNDDNYGSVVDLDGDPVSSFTVPTGSLIEIDDESIIIGKDVYLEAVPADNGTETSYKFVDWTISPSCETVDGDITITANFEEYPTEYKVTLSYNSEYGSVAKTGSGDLDKVPYGTLISVDTENSNVLHVGNNITLTATPEDEVDEYKYSFTGWTFTSPLSGAQTITANFARANKYALLYDLGGGEAIGDYDDDGYYVEGTTITLPTDVEKEGYEFKGFYDNEDFEGTPYEGSFVINEDTFLYAKLTKETYSVSYNKGQYGDGEIASQTKTYGESLTLSSSVFTRTGYTQVGWAISDGGEKAYDLGGTYTANAGVTLYPVWELNTYTVSYDKGSYGQGEIASQTKSYGINLALRDSVFTRTGYTQVGWATSDGGEKAYDLGGTYSANAGVTLYPVWELNTYTVSYDKGSYGQGEIASQTKSYGINLALRDSVFTRTGYTQVGWATSDGGSKAYDLGGTYSENAGITLYPVWKANTYVVNYAPGTDATGSIDSQEKVHDVALTLSSSTFTKEGYEQIGWAISDGGEKAYDLGGSYTANEGVTLYPVWRETALHKAQVYAKNFMDNVGGLCEDTENILDENRAAQLAALATEWANQAEAFAALDQDVKDILMSKDITPNPEGTDIEKFISLYDYTMGRYPQGDGAEVTLSNFLSRTQSSAARKVISISDVSISTWIIAAVAIVGIAAVGVFFIYRKRKEI